MKRGLCLLLAMLLLLLLFTGCAKEENTEPDMTGTYKYEESTDVIKPAILLEDNSQFQFTYSALSSYRPIGTYEVDGEYLFLKTDDEKYEYVFVIKEDTLIFDDEKSSELPSYANMPDGAVFK